MNDPFMRLSGCTASHETRMRCSSLRTEADLVGRSKLCHNLILIEIKTNPTIVCRSSSHSNVQEWSNATMVEVALGQA